MLSLNLGFISFAMICGSEVLYQIVVIVEFHFVLNISHLDLVSHTGRFNALNAQCFSGTICVTSHDSICPILFVL